MDFNQFCKEWKDCMVYKISSDFDLIESLNEWYIEFKNCNSKLLKPYSVKEWCEFWFEDVDLDSHYYMLKNKALNSKHSNGLIEMANKYRSNMNLPLIKLHDED